MTREGMPGNDPQTQIAKAQTPQELYAALIEIGKVSGSLKSYKSTELIDIIQHVLAKTADIAVVTREFGLRDKVQDLLEPGKKSKEEHDKLVSKNLGYIDAHLADVASTITLKYGINFKGKMYSAGKMTVHLDTQSGVILGLYRGSDGPSKKVSVEKGEETITFYVICLDWNKGSFAIADMSLDKLKFFNGKDIAEVENYEVKLSDKAKSVLDDSIEKWNAMTEVM